MVDVAAGAGRELLHADAGGHEMVRAERKTAGVERKVASRLLWLLLYLGAADCESAAGLAAASASGSLNLAPA